MKSVIASIICLFSFSMAAWAANQGEIKVHVEGLKNDQGVVRVALYNSEDAYAADKGKADKAFAKTRSKIEKGQSDCSFTDVPYGTYGIKLFHDEDDSGKFVTNMFGMPKVEFAFSNNAKANFGPPSFNKISFELNSPKMSMTIRMQN